jgi:peptidoglycan hydrolase CwlO-like protein
MKKRMIVGIALVMGMLSAGAVSASAAGSCCNDGSCADEQAGRQYTQETASVAGALKAKDLELREQYSYEGIDTRKVNSLEAELKELKGKLKAAAAKYGVPDCCLG